MDNRCEDRVKNSLLASETSLRTRWKIRRQSKFQEQAPSSKLKKSHKFANVDFYQQVGREDLEGAQEELRWGDASHRHELVSHSEVCARVTSDKTILELKIEAT